MKLTRREFVLLAMIIYLTFVDGTFFSQFNFWLRAANHLFVTALPDGLLQSNAETPGAMTFTAGNSIRDGKPVLDVVGSVLNLSAR